MEKRLLNRKILKVQEDEESGGIPFSRNRSDSLPGEGAFSLRLGKRRQSLPNTSGKNSGGVDKTEKLLKVLDESMFEGILKLQNSAKNLDSAKRTVQDILDSRRPSALDLEELKDSGSFSGGNNGAKSPPTLRIVPPQQPPTSPPPLMAAQEINMFSRVGRWMRSKWEDKVSSRSADKDVKKAVKGVEEAGEVINQMEDSLLKAEEELRARALALRRQSADAFKLVSSGIKTVNISYPEEEEEASGRSSFKEEDIDIEEAIHAFAQKKGDFVVSQQVTNL